MLEGTVKALRQFGAWVVLLVSGLTPAMACMVPDAQLTPEERACCRMMHHQCDGQMDMAGSGSCCKTTDASVLAGTCVEKSFNLYNDSVSLCAVKAPEVPAPIAHVAWALGYSGYSPPQSPPSTISVLRI
jgi:hypothetical protein